MTTFFLIRHAAHDLVGRRLAGRIPGVHLNDAGRREAQQLAERLVGCGIDRLYSSPRERARETAVPCAEALGLSIGLSEASDDIDFGAWTGRAFTELEDDPQWPVWVRRRSTAQPPGGETIVQVQRRIVGELTALAAAHPDETVALFSHCDVIKSALAHFLVLSLDELERFEIAPASISVVLVGGDWAQVRRVNDTLALRA